MADDKEEKKMTDDYPPPQNFLQWICIFFVGPPFNKLHMIFVEFLKSVPPLILFILATNHKLIAIWLSFGVGAWLAVCNFYEATFRPTYSSWYWMDVMFLVAALAVGIVNAIISVPFPIVRNIPTTGQFVGIVASMLVRQPFQKQIFMKKMTPEKLEQPWAKKMIWDWSWAFLVCWTIMLICQWSSLAFVVDSTPGAVEYTNKYAYQFLGIAVPLVVPFGFLTPYMLWYMINMKKKRAKAAADGGKDADATGADETGADGTGADGTGADKA